MKKGHLHFESRSNESVQTTDILMTGKDQNEIDSLLASMQKELEQRPKRDAEKKKLIQELSTATEADQEQIIEKLQKLEKEPGITHTTTLATRRPQPLIEKPITSSATNTTHILPPQQNTTFQSNPAALFSFSQTRVGVNIPTSFTLPIETNNPNDLKLQSFDLNPKIPFDNMTKAERRDYIADLAGKPLGAGQQFFKKLQDPNLEDKMEIFFLKMLLKSASPQKDPNILLGEKIAALFPNSKVEANTNTTTNGTEFKMRVVS